MMKLRKEEIDVLQYFQKAWLQDSLVASQLLLGHHYSTKKLLVCHEEGNDGLIQSFKIRICEFSEVMK